MSSNCGAWPVKRSASANRCSSNQLRAAIWQSFGGGQHRSSPTFFMLGHGFADAICIG